MSVDTVSLDPVSPPSSDKALLPVGEFQGKKVFHWSFYVQAVGALGGLIITIAGLVLATPALIGPGLLFLASNAIGAYYVHTFSVYSQLDSYVNELQEKLTAAQADLIQQRTLNNELNDLLKKTQKEMASLQEAGKKSLADWAEREKSLNEKVDALDKTTKEIEEERKRAFADFDKRFKELHAEYLVLETNKKALDAQIISLKAEVNSTKETNGKLETELNEFKTNYDKYDKENEELRQLNADLQKQVKELTEQIKALPKLNTKPIVKELDETEIAANKVVDEIDNLNKKLEELLKKS